MAFPNKGPSESLLCRQCVTRTSNSQLYNFHNFHLSFRFYKFHSASTVTRDFAFLLRVSEMTPSAFGISLWMHDLFFPPPGSSTRQAVPESKPKPGWEAKPRCWHTERYSDPLSGPGHRSFQY